MLKPPRSTAFAVAPSSMQPMLSLVALTNHIHIMIIMVSLVTICVTMADLHCCIAETSTTL